MDNHRLNRDRVPNYGVENFLILLGLKYDKIFKKIQKIIQVNDLLEVD